MTNTYHSRPILQVFDWRLERKIKRNSKYGYAWGTIEILDSVVKMCSIYASSLRKHLIGETFHSALRGRDRNVATTYKPYWTVWRGIPR